MSAQEYNGIIIKITDYAEYDQIIKILTEKEVFSFIALGVRKLKSKNRPSLQLGNIVEAEIFKSRLINKLSKLKKANIVKQPPLDKIDTVSVLMFVIQVIQKVQNKVDKIYKAYTEGFGYLGTELNHHFKTYVIARMLDNYGKWPIFDYCVECSQNKKIRDFSFYKGGFLCMNHSRTKRTLVLLKSFQALGKSFNEYIKVSPKANFYIFKELMQEIQE